MKIVTLCSGGLDSVVLAYMLSDLLHTQTLLFVHYGQKYVKEHFGAIECTRDLGVPLVNVAITGEALFKSDTTVVPNRNSILANLAAALAVSLDYDGIALGIQQGDSPTFPDTTPGFVHSLEWLLCLATNNIQFKVFAPLIRYTKAEIVALGAVLRVPFERTWSCYKGGELHCGACLACKGRKEAFRDAGLTDPTQYKEQKDATVLEA